MTSEEMHRIFEPFYSTKGKNRMGLLLSDKSYQNTWERL